MATCPLEEEAPSSSDAAVHNLTLGSTCIITSSVKELQVLLTWGGPSTDADLLAILFDKQGNALDAVGYCHLRSQASAEDSGAVRLVSGDQRCGQIGERLAIQPHALPAVVDSIAIIAVSAEAEVSVVDLEPMTLHFEAETTSAVATTGSPADCVAFRYRVPSSSAEERRTVSHGDVKHMMLLAALTRRSRATLEWSLIAHRSVLHGSVIADAVPRTCAVLGLPSTGHVNFSFPLHLTKAGQRVAIVDPRTHQHHGLCSQHDNGAEAPSPFEVVVGVGWDAIACQSHSGTGPEKATDIDLGCVAFNASTGEMVDFLYWGKLTGLNGALRHTGDNTTGEGDGIDEGVHLHLDRIPATVTSLVFSVSHYSGAALSTRNAIFCVVKRVADEAELVRMEGIGAGGNYQSFVPCILERENADATWLLKSVSLPASGDGVSSSELREELRAVAQDSWRKLVSVTSHERLSSGMPKRAAPRESINLRLATQATTTATAVAAARRDGQSTAPPILVHRAGGGADPRQLVRRGADNGAKGSPSARNATPRPTNHDDGASATQSVRDLVNRVPFWVLAAVAILVARLMLRLL